LNAANRPAVSRAQTSVPALAAVIHRAPFRASWNIPSIASNSALCRIFAGRNQSGLEGADAGVAVLLTFKSTRETPWTCLSQPSIMETQKQLPRQMHLDTAIETVPLDGRSV